MIKRNNLNYNVSSINEYVSVKNINQPIQVVVKDVILISDYKLKIIYNNGATKDIELVNNSIKKFEYVSEGNKIIIETNNNDKFEIEIPIDGSKWELVEGLLRTKDGVKITLHDISEIDSDLGAEDEFLNKKGEFVTPSHSALENKNEETDFQHVTQEEKDLIDVHTVVISDLQANKANKATTLSGYAITDAYTKTEIDAKISAVFRYKGSIPTLVDLTALVGMTVGDVYNVTETGDNYAWTGTEWDKLSGEIDLSAYLTIVDASNTYETKVNVNSLGNIVSGHTEDISDLQANKADKATTLSGYAITDAYTKTEIDANFVNHKTYSDVTREDLLTLISNNEIVPNSSYRITNYTTTTAQTDTTSTGHDFDIIVTALSTNELSEIASCVRKAGDTYFENAKLEAWELKYCINNDTSRFAWADAVNGKGVIYYMKDDWNNECPYDFKNIQFKKSEVFLYTFGGTTDDSLTGRCHHNKMMEYTSSSVLTLNFNTFGTGCYGNNFANNCRYNVLGNGCNSNTFDYRCDSNTLGNYSSSNTFGGICSSNTISSGNSNTFGTQCSTNTIGNSCFSNTFGNSCKSNIFGSSYSYNTFGNNCSSNTFGNNFMSNTFGNNCSSNTFGNVCMNITFGNYCSSNTFGNWCYSNSFGNTCKSNTFGNFFSSNTFGNNCSYNNFYAGTSGTTKKDYINYIVLEDDCSYNNFYSDITTSSSSFLQRIRIKGLEFTTPTNTQITLSEINTKYEWLVCYTSSGVLKQYCPEYSLINNYTYKIENTIVSTWTASTAYTKYQYEAVIPIQNIKESDSVEVIYSIPDADSNNYAPDGELYDGHIKIFAKVNTTITIPALIITKIDL